MRTTPPSHGPEFIATGLPDVTYFRETESSHAYRVWHEDWYCLCLVEAGAGDVRYRNRTLLLEKDHAFVFAPGEVHETRRVHVPGTYHVVMVPAAAVHARAEAASRRDVQLPITLDSHHPVYQALLELTLALQFAAQAQREDAYARLLEAMVTNDVRAKTEGTTELPEASTPRVVRAVREFLLDNDDPSLTLSDVAIALKVSPGYVSRVFSEHGYCPPKTWLRLSRVGRARKMLVTDPRRGVQNAALSVGFRAVEKFNTAFRVAWNLSPTEYLRRQGFQLAPLPSWCSEPRVAPGLQMTDKRRPAVELRALHDRDPLPPQRPPRNT